MQKLHEEEKQVMQMLWQLERASLEQLQQIWPEPKLPLPRIRAIFQDLTERGFVMSKIVGKQELFFPTIELTRAEEQIMQVLWRLKHAFVKDVIKELPEPKPAYNTVSTIIRILQDKGFVGHKPHGKTHEYFPLIEKSKYSNYFLKNFMGKYFGGSFEKLVSFFVKQNDLDIREFEDLMKHLGESEEMSSH
ncbi:MAG: BlaI/MecI/CopY family transcriptional regulator [Microscillaceae bacterium]|nr:BlaI/MecI/CopY family transcriptional regulator [Microscillaceae bacterium]